MLPINLYKWLLYFRKGVITCEGLCQSCCKEPLMGIKLGRGDFVFAVQGSETDCGFTASHKLRILLKNTCHWQMFELKHKSTKCSRQSVSFLLPNQVQNTAGWQWYIAYTDAKTSNATATPQHRVHTPLRWCNFL